MKGICRVCLQVDPTVPFFSLADEDTRNLFEDCTFATKDDTYTQLCPECHYQCVERKRFRSKAIKTIQRRLKSLSGRNETGTEADHCLVCLQDTLASKSYYPMDAYARELFTECTDIVLVKREDNDQQRLCGDCFNICLRSITFRSQAIESHQKLKHLSVEKLHCRVEITRVDSLFTTEVVPVNEYVKLKGEPEHTECAEYSIDTVNQEMPVVEKLPVDSECNLEMGEWESIYQLSAGPSDEMSQRRSWIAKPSHCEAEERDLTENCNAYQYEVYTITLVSSPINADVTQFTCDVCSKFFIDNSTLMSHKRIHTGYGPYKCEICSKSFRHRGSLAGHKIIHTGEMPFKCDLCNRSFRYKSNFNKHKRVHAG